MRFRFFFVLFSFMFLVSCNDELIINAEYKDITIVYGLISSADTVQYIKITKAFLNKNNDALVLAKNIDSLYYKDSLYVILQEFINGNLVRTLPCDKIFDSGKDSGTFAYPGQYLYRTPSTMLAENGNYRLTITNTKTGKVITSSSPLVGPFSPDRPIPGGFVAFNPSTDYEIIWYSGKNAYFYDLTIKITYREYQKANPSNKVEKTLNWPIFSYRKTNSLNGNEKMNMKLPGATFFDFLSANIVRDVNIEREFGTIAFVFSAGGEEIFYYINVNKPTVGAVQKKPEYTNIDNGYGVFSSRNQGTVNTTLSPLTINEVKTNSATSNLNFVK